jgi:SAM-dependent methyltransferase
MQLKRPLPPNRTYEQLLNHYNVEKALANKLRTATREERKQLYAYMYHDLFAAVPDHSRLTRRQSESETRKANQAKMALVRKHLAPSITFAEFASGDCGFLKEAAALVNKAIGIDISDQRLPSTPFPENCELVIYDGYDLSSLRDSSVDLLFSDQLVEHFHPEDTPLHFRTACRILRPGGRYILRTPHLFTGPWDISKYFSETPQGFHLKEWTFHEIIPELHRAGFHRVRTLALVRGVALTLPSTYFTCAERTLGVLPRSLMRPFARHMLREVIVEAIKQ